jgi:hypothetical protein
MISARSFVAGLSASLFLTTAHAQGGFYNWSQFARWCLSTNGTPVPNPPRCFPNQSAPAQTVPPQEDTTFSQDLRAYSDLLNRASRELPDFDGIEAISTSPADLSEHLDHLYDRLINVSNDENARLIDEKNDRDRLETIPGDIAAMNKEASEIQHRNELMHNYVDISSYESRKLAQYAGDQISRAINWLDYARPSDLPRHRGTVSPTSMDIPNTDEYFEPAVAVFPTRSNLSRDFRLFKYSKNVLH